VPRDYHIAAERYRPLQVQVLIIAESPPAFSTDSKQSYFYFEDNPSGDMLFATIVQAVLGITYFKKAGPRKAEILRQFQSERYWLMDAVERPINKIDGRRTSDGERKPLIEMEQNRLFERIAALNTDKQSNDMSIVLIKDLVYKCLAEPLRKTGYRVPQVGKIGFPRYERDPATIEGIRSALASRRRV
jgi:hypothetical protein